MDSRDWCPRAHTLAFLHLPEKNVQLATWEEWRDHHHRLVIALARRLPFVFLGLAENRHRKTRSSDGDQAKLEDPEKER